MNRTRLTGLAGVLASVAALTATSFAVTTAADARPAVTARSSAALAFTTVHVQDRKVTLPATLRPGLRAISVTANKPREASFLYLRPGYTLAQAVADMNASFAGQQPDLTAVNRFYDSTVIAGGIVGTPLRPGHGVITLSAGQWYALVPQFPIATSRFTPFKVTGPKTTTATPTYTATLTAVHDHQWGPNPVAIPTRGLLRFRNIAESPHFLEIDQLAPGKTYADFKRWIQAIKSGQQVPPPFGKAHTFGGVVSPGHNYAFDYALPKGKYVVMCFMPDRKTGMPHVFMGMSRPLTVR